MNPSARCFCLSSFLLLAAFQTWPLAPRPLPASEPADEEAARNATSPLAANTPLPETGLVSADLASFDELMRSFLQEHEIPGAALAVAKEGRVVYARGFGYADRERQRPVEPHALFRIASVSKPITAMAVLRLVDQGVLTLDQPVLELLPHQAHLPEGRSQDPRLSDITIRHLLQHTAGWDRDVSIDPMFHSLEIASALGTPPPATPDDIVQFMLGWPLDFAPGDRHAYSNFGYCLLGRVIEQVSGMGYEQYVREQLLAPLGISSMQVGQTLESQQAPGEVRYDLPRERFAFGVTGDQLGRRVPRPYGAWSLEAMDSHGGWIASAIDLVRFGSAVDRWQDSHLLSAESIAAMVARPEGSAGHEEDGSGKPVYYGLGWMVRHVDDEGGLNLWHNGRFDGASSLLVLRHDGLCWAALFNTSATPDGQAPAGKLDSLLHRAANAVEHWPEHDLSAQD
jgi:N-acyl-D-amino-acid deacylase